MFNNILFYLDNLQISLKSVSLQCVFHSIRFKVNKGWSKALLLFFMPIPLKFPFQLHQLNTDFYATLWLSENNPVNLFPINEIT